MAPHSSVSVPLGPGKPSPLFATTRWSLVLSARDKSAPDGAAALADLCRAYWFPLYSFIRRSSRDGHEAQDLTQSFFTRLLEKDFLDDVQPERGRFRSFLLAAIRHFVSNERDKQRADKRGGKHRHVSLNAMDVDWESGESRYLTVPAQNLTPERLFERQWALALLERVLLRLRDEYSTAEKRDHFETLQPFLSTDRESANYAEVANQLNCTVEAARAAARRMRQRYRQLLRDEIADTVAFPEQIDEEIRHLFDVLSNS